MLGPTTHFSVLKVLHKVLSKRNIITINQQQENKESNAVAVEKNNKSIVRVLCVFPPFPFCLGRIKTKKTENRTN